MNRLEVPWRALDAVLVVVAWFGLQVLIFVMLGQLNFIEPVRKINQLIETGDIVASFALVLINSLLIGALIWLRLRAYGAGWRDLGFRKFKPLRAAIYLILTMVFFQIAVVLMYSLIQALWPAFNPEQEQVNEFINPSGPVAVKLSFIALVLLPAVVEEALFRGFIFPAFNKHWGLWVGAILSSILFGLAHLQANVVIYTFVMGLLLCMMYWKLRSIWPGVIFHGLNNLLAFILLMK